MTRARRLPLAIALAVLGFMVAFVVVSWAWPLVAPTRMLVFAHHGDVAHWPENSLEGVRAAIDLHPDGIEIDVRASRDGTFWMQHDETVDAATDGTGRFSDLLDRDIAALTIDAGPGYSAARHPVIHLATLDAALEALKDFDGPVMVDLKDESIDEHGRLASLVAAALDPDRVLILVQSPEGAQRVKDVDRRFTTVYRNVATWDSAIDAWIAQAEVQVRWPLTTISDLFGSNVMYIEGDHVGDEQAMLENGHRWGVQIVITNDIEQALSWSAAHR